MQSHESWYQTMKSSASARIPRHDQWERLAGLQHTRCRVTVVPDISKHLLWQIVSANTPRLFDHNPS